MPGTIIVLNGPSSAGKSTLALAVRARLGANVAVVSIDSFFACLHPDAKNSWHMFSTLTAATFATATALAGGGLHVIVDTVFERAESRQMAETALAEFTHHVVAVTCDPDELDARESKRGDRRHGQAREQHSRVLRFGRYELTLDTSRLSLDECVDGVASLLLKP